MPAILNYGIAFPSLRLAATAYRDAWGSCSARGLRRKAFCAFDEDPLTLAIAAGKAALKDRRDAAAGVGAIFVGTTTWPYEEKPASASIVTALLGRDDVRCVEIRGSRQAGLQALCAAAEFVASHPGCLALAIAADAPFAAPDKPFEHALGAGAAAFLIGEEAGVAFIEGESAVTVETFGSRFRALGAIGIQDLELRVDDDQKAMVALSKRYRPETPDFLALGVAGDVSDRAAMLFGGAPDGLWPELGDAGAAASLLALAHCLDQAKAGQRVLALAAGGGASAVLVSATRAQAEKPTVSPQLKAGEEVGYLAYLKHKRILSSQRSAAQ